MQSVTAVFVDGFDFGTPQPSIQAHMSQAGTIKSIQMKKGSAVVTYSSNEEATYATSSLDKSTIAGNSRFIEVKLDKKSLPPKPGMKRSFEGDEGGGSCKVLVRGFDFETTDEQFEAHLGTVGTIESVHWVSKGSANVIYSSAAEATAAIQQLNGSIIPGHSRYIDVIPGGDRAVEKYRKGSKGGGKGGGWGGATFSGGKGKKGGGKGKKGGDHSDEDPPGSGRVFVRGFDFGTDDTQLEAHMKRAGPLHTIHWVNQGNAVVVYKMKASAGKAVASLDNTVIAGNSRYINVTARN